MIAEIRLNKRTKTIKIVNRKNSIRLTHTGKRGPQGIQGIQGPPGTTDYNELLNKPDLNGYATEIHVDTLLAGKAELVHVHTIADVTGLQMALDGKQPVGDYATTSELVDGEDGREVELQTSATHVQWRYVGDVAWTDLIALTAITGPAGADGADGAAGADGDDGLSVELQTTATHVQWRLVGGTWADLVALSTITGPSGADGEDGAAGADGADADTSGQFAVNIVAASGAAETLPATHAAHKVTMDQNCEFTFSSPTAGHAFVLHLLGAFTPTWPASVDWAGGTAPTYASGTLYHFVTVDGGSTWLGSGQAYS